MKQVKRILRMVFLLAVVIGCLSFHAFAEEMELMTTQMDLCEAADALSLQGETDTREAEEYIYAALSAGETEIDVLRFGFTLDKQTGQSLELIACMERVRYHHPDLFYVLSWPYYVNSRGSVTRIVPVYMADAQRKEAQALYQGELETILKGMEKDWSDLEKILYINDYLASRYRYDLRVKINSQAANYDAYTFFRDGTGVCQAYYNACKALLDACGIPSTFGISERANHIWNVVRLNGKWYHLDVTWNDPTNDILGLASHEYFLLSTDKLLELDPNRTDWVCGEKVSCTDTTYNDYYWREVSAPFVMTKGDWYYSAEDAICVTDDVSRTGKAVINHELWRFQGGYWPGTYSGLGTYKGWLIYNTGNAVMGYEPVSKQLHTFATFSEPKRLIFGMAVLGNKAVCERDIHPWCNADAYSNGACGENREEEVSLAWLDELNAKSYGGVTASEDGGLVTVQGKPDPKKPFCVIAAGYTTDGKLCDRKMIWSTELSSGKTQWQMKGAAVKIFMLTQQTWLPVG